MAELLICTADRAPLDACIGLECGRIDTFERDDVAVVLGDGGLWGYVRFDPAQFRVVWLPLIPKALAAELLRPEVFSLGGSIGAGRARACALDLDALLAHPDPAMVTPEEFAGMIRRKAPLPAETE